MQLPLNVSPVSASFFGLKRPGIHLVLCVACSLLFAFAISRFASFLLAAAICLLAGWLLAQGRSACHRCGDVLHLACVGPLTCPAFPRRTAGRHRCVRWYVCILCLLSCCSYGKIEDILCNCSSTCVRLPRQLKSGKPASDGWSSSVRSLAPVLTDLGWKVSLRDPDISLERR